ncbi:MAG: ABC transporter ATP-binding protein [Candidatus Kerfeldbacteria bacterium RIFCSPHIGHO2_02_FULL_42_14]|uniref:ABC transporter ATP-binding protein n=1 Tax=Candidatus Kerfeldbacteria bacterium RIFCSPHIGHO2_02_FULL_42_14 TaxID=1798540 RepID=A0A1G2ANY0_9BACT|nr:MAG: ABC transporter ATP-binding protein [Candidatus Kerfeldbacteria bacterium RIFCSPHIGHO2_02_FULL_42_14]OGY82140.1 MAG: ABC transporter ATP-binding protein [Candidatus Kerfeldbacteria bacterium RIFCSPHIGHO2_12_FULL_42_13]OGY84965.1 MAG: ABC transporter ATP-binding protein [Candidatus Kerfeldbacteria bacterium RIFCSPLOWO2_02_FULL_42_19]OGY86132.1 MAG: ABC transporter ATP-binding protein [Candidatus Kerfeldbacteria bacterium RIFCSPLOWO2_12_FULL_43_9]
MPIELQSIIKTYRMGSENFNALDGITATIKDGEFIAIMGPSGSGKSTLANIIGGLDTPSSGKIFVNKEDISRAWDRALSHYRNKKVGFVFQTFNLQPHYTALENVMLPLIFSKVRLRARKKKAVACLEAVGLGDRMKHKPGELSGGQRQRVSIARSLANNPEIIIADEPTGNLDSKRSTEIIALLKKLREEKNITLIIITHDMNIAHQADRVIYIQDGKIKKAR